MSQFFGRATVTINGQTFNSKPGASFDPGGVTRSTETTDQRSGYTEALRPAVVKLEIPLESGISVPSMNDMDNVTVQFSADTGQTYVLSNAWRVEALEVTGGSGGMSLEFHADKSVEVS